MRRKMIGTLKYVMAAGLMGAALVLQPAAVVGAQGANVPTSPPTVDTGDARLERTWLRQQRALDRLEFMFVHSQQRLNNAQELIDRAKAQGKDVVALQAALDAFSKALQEARPSFDNAKDILNSHNGFDADGNVVDSARAAVTVEDMSQELDDVRDALLQPGRDLRDAIRAFWESNRP
jgi:hypothetical protein